MTGFLHKPVLLQETMDILDLRPGMKVVDCTAGAGGHSRSILERILPDGFLVAVDRDLQALEKAEENLGEALKNFVYPQENRTEANPARKPYTTVHSNFARIKEILNDLDIREIDRVMMDLGVSSLQLDDGDRGFSYQHPGILDMRMDPSGDGITAGDVINTFSAKELEEILWRYGEERWSRRISRFIIEERDKAPITTTDKLAAIIRKAIPAAAREDGPHPAKRSFQALRIYVNGELDSLEQSIADTVELLAPAGRLAVISFHSLEDRIVKETFKNMATGCICPKDFPVCVCGRRPLGKVLTSKPVAPGRMETEENPRSRSAKMRAFQKIAS